MSVKVCFAVPIKTQNKGPAPEVRSRTTPLPDIPHKEATVGGKNKWRIVSLHIGNNTFHHANSFKSLRLGFCKLKAAKSAPV
jgi:hypothetical protein